MSRNWTLTDNIQRREWWPAGWSVAIVLITALPYLYGAWLSTPQNQFGGFVIAVEDGNSYLAKMQEGRAGYWLFYLAYTPEPHQEALFYLFYLTLGKLSSLLNISLVTTLHFSRMIAVIFALLSFYIFVAYFTASLRVRRLAFLLFGLTAGFGWLWAVLGFPTALGAMPVDLWVPDASFFLSALTFPHLTLAQGLLLWTILGTLTFFERGDISSWFIGAGAALLVSLVHPFKVGVVTPIFLAYLAWQSYTCRRILWRKVWRFTLVILPSLPYLLYSQYVFETNFAFYEWRAQNFTWSPQPIHYILGFGLLLPFAGLGMWQAKTMEIARFQFLIIWSLVVPFLLYFPVPFQRRFVDGYQAVLAILGAIGLGWILDRLKTKRQQMVVLVATFLPMTLTNILLLTGSLLTIQEQGPLIFHSGAQQSALSWLDQNASGQVILSTSHTGNVIPAYALARVFVGHSSETNRFAEKNELVSRFFSASTADAWRQQLLKQYGVDYIYYGPQERTTGDFQPAGSVLLEAVYDNGSVQIYQVGDLE